jgi:hypothetical protein
LQVRLSSQLPLHDSSIAVETRQKLPKGWEKAFNDTIQLKGLVDILAMATETSFDSGKILSGCEPDIKALLVNWSKIQRMKSGKTPKLLQHALDHLLVEWVFLARDNYTSLDSNLSPNYLKPEPVVGAAKNQSLFDGRIHWNDTQPWFPLFVEWEAEYFHVPIDKWEIQEESDGTVFGAIDHEQQLSSMKGIRNDMRVVSGRSLILPQVSQTLKGQLEQLFKHSTAEDESETAKKEKEDILTQLSNLPFLSTSLIGITDHLLTLVQGTHVSPHDNDPLDGVFSADKLGLLQGATTDVSPYGRYMDFQHHRRDGKDNAFSPFKPVTHGQVRFTQLNIIDKFGQVVPALNNHGGQELVPLRPYTSKSLSLSAGSPCGTLFLKLGDSRSRRALSVFPVVTFYQPGFKTQCVFRRGRRR